MKYDRIRDLSDKCKAGKMAIDDLKDYKLLFSEFVKFVTDEEEMRKSGSKYVDVIEKFLALCNDYYVFSESGDVLITDRQYDEVTQVYKALSGNSQVIYTDSVNVSRWNERKHLSPNMVGSVEKTYDLDELNEWIWEHSKTGEPYIILTPKYDGCSVVLTFDKAHELVAALTRKDGVYGQDLTPLVYASMKEGRLDKELELLNKFDGPVDLKCEILVGQTEFDELRKEKAYKNRRAAASAISANPSNIKYAKYLTFMPLVAYCDGVKTIVCPWQMKINLLSSRKNVIDSILEFEDAVRMNTEYRKDGIIISAMGAMRNIENDVMSDSIAYKFNTQMSQTIIEDCYLSIGRTGKATPMIKVAPCEVNETEVTDVNLSNFKKVNKLDLHIGDIIVIESAGDVIPMVKEVVYRDKHGLPLKFDDICPHCGHRLQIRTKYDQSKGVSSNDFDLYCTNPRCNRIIAGRLTNFLDKLGAKGISDGVMSSVVELTGITSFDQIFKLKMGDMSRHDGWGAQSEADLLDEIERIKDTPHPYSLFLGALGIPMVSVEKCRMLMQNTTFDKLMEAARKDTEACREMIMSVDGFGGILADNIRLYLEDNYHEIMDTANKMNLYQDQISHSKGTVVFSGFRDEELKEKIEELGFKYSENVTKETVAVISATSSSGKAKKAIAKGIPLYASYEDKELLNDLRKL